MAAPEIPRSRALDPSMSDPAARSDTLTPSDTTDLTGLYRALRFDVGGAVGLTVYKRDGTTENIVRNFAAGEMIPGRFVKYLRATGTDAGVVVDGWS